MKRVEFLLTMPGRGSWNGGWSGEGARYAIVRTLPDKQASELDGKSWGYSWSDGWHASIRARVVPKGERLKKSAGFSGYDWMVRNILAHGDCYNRDAAGNVEAAS